jgi:L-ribulokinase
MDYLIKEEVYQSIPEDQKVYKQLFAECLRQHDYFGRGENNVMKTHKKIKAEVKHGAG